jgi:hypothetical protein
MIIITKCILLLDLLVNGCEKKTGVPLGSESQGPMTLGPKFSSHFQIFRGHVCVKQCCAKPTAAKLSLFIGA